jgi:hypothetical protein
MQERCILVFPIVVYFEASEHRFDIPVQISVSDAYL